MINKNLLYKTMKEFLKLRIVVIVRKLRHNLVGFKQQLSNI